MPAPPTPALHQPVTTRKCESPRVDDHVIPHPDDVRGVAVVVLQRQQAPAHRRGERKPMARRTFEMIDLIEIYVHWFAGRSQVQIADSLGIDRKTVRKYLAPVEAEGLVAGGPPVMCEADWRAKAGVWFPAVLDAGLRQVTWPAIAPHAGFIAEQLKAGVTVATVHQRLADEEALTASVASLRRWVAANLPEEVRRSQVRVLRPVDAEPGSEAQIDYGRLGSWIDPESGRRRTVWAFVMVLACSRYMFVRPVLVMDQAAWTRCHVEAFAFSVSYTHLRAHETD